MLLTNRLRLATTRSVSSHTAQSRSYRSSATTEAGKRVKHTESPLNTESVPFDFTLENWNKAKEILAKYPENYKKSALMPLMDLAQRQHGGWLPISAMNKVASICGASRMQAYEVASFYTMYNRNPVGKYFVQLCGTTPCEIRGAQKIMRTLKDELQVENGETTPDGLFTLLEVECLGACVHAPMIQINDDFYEDLDEEATRNIIKTIRAGGSPKTGSALGRKVAEPISGKKTLLGKPRGPYAPFLEQELEKKKAAQQASQ